MLVSFPCFKGFYPLHPWCAYNTRYALAIFGDIWRRMLIFGEDWRRLAKIGDIWRRLAKIGDIWRYLAIFGEDC